MAFGVIACTAIKRMIALLVGSAIAWNTSLLMDHSYFMKPTGCKYIRNRTVSQKMFLTLLRFVSPRTEIAGRLRVATGLVASVRTQLTSSHKKTPVKNHRRFKYYQ
jgi:hypothetical protein